MGRFSINYVLPTLEYMSLNKRKKELLLSIKSEILRDAVQIKIRNILE